jgi:ribonuclease Y
MDISKLVVMGSLAALGGGVIGYLLHLLINLQRKSSAELKIKQLLLDAKDKAQKSIEEAGTKAENMLKEAKQEEKTALLQVRKLEERALQKEETLEKRRTEIDNEEKIIKEKITLLKDKKVEIEELEEKKQLELEKASSLSAEEAKEELLKKVETKYEEDLLGRIHKLETAGKDEFDKKAREILTNAIQRLASSTASEATTTSVSIPSDDLKGKIIGKEGRNIRALERSAGVEVIVDDTPGMIIISAFDPIRRHIAKIALENLISDGRIQPARIEEMVERAKIEVEKTIKQKGEAVAYETGVINLDSRLLTVLGRLHFRTSYGQNVLQHSVEVAHIAGMLASELGADAKLAKKAGLLHDIGKAMDHEVQGTHVDIGKRILQKFGEDEKVIQAMQAHHEEYPFETIESVVIQVADAISAARPGARRDTLENYLKRLEDLEKIATGFEGIEKAYAIQAGREIRVFVTPEQVTDIRAKKLAREIADKIEKELKYPGEIKVNVIRESRVIEYAR